MPAIPASTKSSITLRLLAHAGQNWPQLQKVEVTYRGAFGYVTGVLPESRMRRAAGLVLTDAALRGPSFGTAPTAG